MMTLEDFLVLKNDTDNIYYWKIDQKGVKYIDNITIKDISKIDTHTYATVYPNVSEQYKNKFLNEIKKNNLINFIDYLKIIKEVQNRSLDQSKDRLIVVYIDKNKKICFYSKNFGEKEIENPFIKIISNFIRDRIDIKIISAELLNKIEADSSKIFDDFLTNKSNKYKYQINDPNLKTLIEIPLWKIKDDTTINTQEIDNFIRSLPRTDYPQELIFIGGDVNHPLLKPITEKFKLSNINIDEEYTKIIQSEIIGRIPPVEQAPTPPVQSTPVPPPIQPIPTPPVQSTPVPPPIQPIPLSQNPTRLILPAILTLVAVLIAGFMVWNHIKPPRDNRNDGIKVTEVMPAKPLPFHAEWVPTSYSKGGGMVAGGQPFSTFSIDFHPELGDRIELAGNPGAIGIAAFMQGISREVKKREALPIFNTPSEFFAVTGAMYDEADNLPPGLLLINGQIIKPLNRKTDGKGNFYAPKPNGVFYVTDSSAGVQTTAVFDAVNSSAYRFALQSGPMLITGGSINQGFNPNSANKHFRCGVGIAEKDGKQTIVFTASKIEVSFYELAYFMQADLGCSNALHLESVNSYMYFPGADYPINKQIIKNFLIIR